MVAVLLRNLENKHVVTVVQMVAGFFYDNDVTFGVNKQCGVDCRKRAARQSGVPHAMELFGLTI